jgi:SH3-like domain-containing protein
MSRILTRWAAMVALAVAAIMISTLPAAARTVYVNRTQVAVYAGPASYYSAVCFARRGEALKVISLKGDWIKVKAAGGTGWVFRKGLTSHRSSLKTLNGLAVDTDLFSGVDRTAGIKALKMSALLQNQFLNQLLGDEK